MKKILFAAAAALVLAACTKPNPNAYIINGTVANADGETVYLLAGTDTLGVDVVKDGTYKFEGVVESPKNATTFISNKLYDELILEPGVISQNIDNHDVSGTPLNDEMTELSNKIISIIKELDDENANQDSLMSIYKAIFRETAEKHAGNPLGLKFFEELAYEMTKAQLDSVIALYPLYAADPTLQQICKTKAKEEKTAVGKPYIEVVGVDAKNGKESKLSDYLGKGKPVIVDFWASWCGPCRSEINNYLSKYAKEYKNKVNFLGIAVSENSIEDTQKAMSELPISWPVIYTGGRSEDSPVNTYGISGIPHIMLLAPDGTILARNIRGTQIKEAIDKALAKK
jgi:thiol-disulfide isomerase/thioredoxin